MKTRYLAALMTLGAGIIHALYMQEHFEEWWGYGAFFLVSAIVQLVYVPLLVTRSERWRTKTFYWIGIAGNAAIVALYIVTRTVGIPLFGPHAGDIEEITFLPVLSVLMEVVLVGCLWSLLARRPSVATRSQA